MIRVTIIYHATGIRVEFTPGNANFSSWLAKKIPNPRWHGIDPGKIDLAIDDLTEEEAEYIEQLAIAQAASGDQVKLEVIGKPIPLAMPVKTKSEPEENKQIHLF